MEFEWKIFLEEIQKLTTELQCEPAQFKGGLIFMSMYNDIVWRERRNAEMFYEFCYGCELCSQIPARTFGHFWDLDQRGNGTGLILTNPMENGTRLLNE